VVMFFLGNYRRKTNRLLGNILFFGIANLGGLLLAASLIKGARAAPFANLVQPGVLLLLTIVAGAAGAVGWWLGEQAIKQLRKAGKMDVDL
jgi:hypothetical protein